MIALIYHRVGGRSPSPVDLPVAMFRDQLDELAATGRVVGLDTALDRLGEPAHADGGALDVVLTFDDGTADWADVVVPELESRRLPATFYVATAFVESRRGWPDEGRPVSWAALAEVVGSGVAGVGSHTHSHRVLATVDAAETTDEIDRSIGLIEDHLGVACRHFAYPNAVAGSPAAEVVVRRRFASAALAGNRVNVSGRTDAHRLGRHGLTVADRTEDFARKVAGGGWLEGWLRERRDAGRF